MGSIVDSRLTDFHRPSIELLEMVWEAGCHFDEVMWYNDMGYKNAQFMSVQMYRDLLSRRIVERLNGRTARG